MLKAVLFDLDGTLLQVNTAQFTAEYMKEVAAAVAPAVDAGRFTLALMAGTASMLANKDPAVTNQQAFWEDFGARLKDCVEDVKPLLEEFYVSRFDSLSRLARPAALARQAVQAALEGGLRIAVATQPVFPLTAVHQRMAWAGVEDLPWDYVACYEEMHSCKPNPDYFREIAARLGMAPEECLMLGNDVEEDLVAATVGMRTGLVTDYLINPQNREYTVDWSGTLAQLTGWLAQKSL